MATVLPFRGREPRIADDAFVAPTAVVLEGVEIPERSLVAGVPAEVRKTLEGPEAERLRGGGRHYVELSRPYRAEGIGRPGAGRTREDG